MATSNRYFPTTYFEQGSTLLRHLFPEINPVLLALAFHQGDRDCFLSAYQALCEIVYQRTKNPNLREGFLLPCATRTLISMLKRNVNGAIILQDYTTQPLGIALTDVHLLESISKILYGPLIFLGDWQNTDPAPHMTECECCFVDMPSPDNREVTCLAGHRFCLTCLKSHVEESVFGQNNFSIRCISMAGEGPACSASFPDHAIRSALAENPRLEEEFFRFRDNQKQSKEGADASIPADSQAEATACRDLCHVVAERMTKIILRFCPGCNKPLQKVGGCNSMVCPHCRERSCYVCSERVNSMWMNHACPHFSDAEQDDRRSRDQLLEELKHDAAANGGATAAQIVAALAKLGFHEPLPKSGKENIEPEEDWVDLRFRRPLWIICSVFVSGLIALVLVLAIQIARSVFTLVAN